MTNHDVYQRVRELGRLRDFIWKQTEGLSCEQLNSIPAKFNNNIIWNLGHLSSVFQKMTYERSGLALKTAKQSYFAPFLSGTKPAQFYDEAAIFAIKESSFRVLNQIEVDLDNNRFQTYQPSPKIAEVYGIEVLNLADALNYLIYHEGIHAGAIQALKQMI